MSGIASPEERRKLLSIQSPFGSYGAAVVCTRCRGRAFLTTRIVNGAEHPVFLHSHKADWVDSPHVVEPDDVMVGRAHRADDTATGL